MIDFKDLKVWQKAHHMALATYRVTIGFPKEEIYGLTSQLRRATASIGANIAEGWSAFRWRDVPFYADCSWFCQ